MSAASIPDDTELIKVFGRIADKVIYLDQSAGQCCHSGCDGCEFRYDFGNLRSARPKWVVTYASRVFEDTHAAKWTSLFDTKDSAAGASDEDTYNTQNNAVALSGEAFAQRLADLPYAAPIGPAKAPPKADAPTKETAIWLWERLLADRKAQALTARLMEKQLLKWADGGDSLMWEGFRDALRAQPAQGVSEAASAAR